MRTKVIAFRVSASRNSVSSNLKLISFHCIFVEYQTLLQKTGNNPVSLRVALSCTILKRCLRKCMRCFLPEERHDIEVYTE